MNWSYTFYQLQNELVPIYTSDEIQIQDLERVRLIKRHMAHLHPNKLLELGAGGGHTACASAMAGFEVTAIEWVTIFAEHILKLTKKYGQYVKVVNDDFYKVELDETFDIITYWDGFGIGTDDDQIRLLKRCNSWLKPNGRMLLDIYTPWYWAQAHGQKMQFGDIRREYHFDVLDCRMVDTWWHSNWNGKTIMQSLRCYSIADFQLLLRDTGLMINDVVATGGRVTEDGTYEARANLRDAMTYTLQLTKAD